MPDPTPTPITKHRRYTKRDKVNAVVSAMATTVQAAAETLGIPERTLGYWMDHPQFAELRAKTKDDLGRGFQLLAHRSQEVLMTRIPEMEPRDLTILLGVSTDKAQLLSGAATNRTETRALSDGLNDHEKQQLRDGLDRLLGVTAPEGAAVVEIGAGSEVRE